MVGFVVGYVCCCLVLAGMCGCAEWAGERIIYDRDDVRIGVEPDPSVRRAKQPINNAHPAQMTTEDMKALFGVIRVSGWSGTIAGIFMTPRPVPLLTEAQLDSHAVHLSEAFAQAKPHERVFFSFPKPEVHYSEDRTTGAVFFRDRYLHVVVTDHSSVIQADTAGGDAKDIRDTKGMKLWVSRPAVEATVPDAEEPRWAPFETVHISLNVKQALSVRSTPASSQIGREAGARQLQETSPSQQDLQNQIRELTNSNLELRERLEEEKAKVKEMTNDMNRLRFELDQSKGAKQPSRKQNVP
jgi:hypothetical protein